MFSLSISFGPTGMVWAYLFKELEKPQEAYNAYVDYKVNHAENGIFIGSDDFGQCYAIPFDEIRGMMFEDLDLIEAARIQRSLADERCKAKFLQAARSDSTIRAGMGNQMPIMQPMGGFPRN
jgi:hypothetical protein